MIARVHNPERRKEWLSVLGMDEIPVLSPIPRRANLPGIENALCYEMDVEALNSEQLIALIRHLAAKFKMDIAAVRDEVIGGGVPILANDVTVIGSIPWWL